MSPSRELAHESRDRTTDNRSPAAANLGADAPIEGPALLGTRLLGGWSKRSPPVPADSDRAPCT